LEHGKRHALAAIFLEQGEPFGKAEEIYASLNLCPEEVRGNNFSRDMSPWLPK
jgi:hypothetical protein